MSYCEDEALFFESAIPVDQIEPELVLASEPVAQGSVTVRFTVHYRVMPGSRLEFVEWMRPPVRAPPHASSWA